LLQRAEAVREAALSHTRQADEIKPLRDAAPMDVQPRLNRRIDLPVLAALPSAAEIEAGSIIDPWRGTPSVAAIMVELGEQDVGGKKAAAQPQADELDWDAIDALPSPQNPRLELPPLPAAPPALEPLNMVRFLYLIRH
jgi:hypothetical protein